MKNIGPAKTTQQLAHAARKLAGFEQKQLEAMRSLTPPASMASDWKQMIEAADEIAASAGNLSTDIQLKKQKQAVQAFKQISEVHEHVVPIIERDGFTSCKELT
jgi:hypothetical protein